MYFCPTNAEHDEFRREIAATVAERLNTAGEITGEAVHKQEFAVRPAPVFCADCGARAEWRDTRQLEMFATEPEMFPT